MSGVSRDAWECLAVSEVVWDVWGCVGIHGDVFSRRLRARLNYSRDPQKFPRSTLKIYHIIFGRFFQILYLGIFQINICEPLADLSEIMDLTDPSRHNH